MKLPFLSILLALPLAAQGGLFQEDTVMPPTVGVNVQAGFPLGETAKDLNRGIGFGASLTYQRHLGGRHVLRGGLEYNAYRLDAPPPPAWAADTRQKPTLDVWKAGLDYLLYLEPWAYGGPYALAGIGIEHSTVSYQVQRGAQQILDTERSVANAPWFGAGIGYQITPDVAVELRYSITHYGAQQGQPLASYTATAPVKREGRLLHLVLALRVPI